MALSRELFKIHNILDSIEHVEKSFHHVHAFCLFILDINVSFFIYRFSERSNPFGLRCILWQNIQSCPNSKWAIPINQLETDKSFSAVKSMDMRRQ